MADAFLGEVVAFELVPNPDVFAVLVVEVVALLLVDLEVLPLPNPDGRAHVGEAARVSMTIAAPRNRTA